MFLYGKYCSDADDFLCKGTERQNILYVLCVLMEKMLAKRLFLQRSAQLLQLTKFNPIEA